MGTENRGNQALKNNIIAQIDCQKDVYIQVSHDIHDRPEIGNQEFYAAKRLGELLKSSGFAVETNIAGYATGFIARRKSKNGRGPAIGFLAEYDALPELGHACGHNIIGTASVAAALSLANVLDELGGEVVVFGTPAEEGGVNGSAKASYVQQGLFKNIDACLMIHPANRSVTTENALALDPLDFEFFGKAAHAAAAPEQGINALDGVIQLFNGINALRQQLASDIRIHGIIIHGGDAPNIIPAYAKARFFVRAANRSRCDETTSKVKAIAEGAALATGTQVKIGYFQNQVDDFVINQKFNTLFQEVMAELGENLAASSNQSVGSTDAGNVSHVVPTIQPSLKIGPPEMPSHSVEFCKAAKSKEGDAALLVGAKALAITGLILLTDHERLQAIRAEFQESKSR
ncbi:MAG TPA: amidohydrolase [Firmicutes bacterium]|nr:amidohydrolase [Bacillota bacterium]